MNEEKTYDFENKDYVRGLMDACQLIAHNLHENQEAQDVCRSLWVRGNEMLVSILSTEIGPLIKIEAGGDRDGES